VETADSQEALGGRDLVATEEMAAVLVERHGLVLSLQGHGLVAQNRLSLRLSQPTLSVARISSQGCSMGSVPT